MIPNANTARKGNVKCPFGWRTLGIDPWIVGFDVILPEVNGAMPPRCKPSGQLAKGAYLHLVLWVPLLAIVVPGIEVEPLFLPV